MSRISHLVVWLLGVCFLAGCQLNNSVTTAEIDPAGHMTRQDYLDLRERGDAAAQPDDVGFPPIPVTPQDLIPPPPPPPVGSDRRVSISVTDSVPLRDVLMELARESQVNLELDSRIQGGIIFTAHNQPFYEVLQRICAMAGLRSSFDGNFIHIELDEPYQQSYPLDYLSLARRAVSETSIATNVFDVNVANSSTSGNGSSNGASASENNSTSKVSGSSEADLWTEVGKSITQILASSLSKSEREKPEASFSMDKQAGMITVYGTQRQQKAVETYLDKLRKKANAQVLIDARIIEVQLDDAYKSGINWSALPNILGTRVGLASVFTPPGLDTGNLFTAAVDSKGFAGILNLVSSFGTTRVLSAPRLTVMNNQTAMLKVATNQVYFVTQAQFTTVTNANGSAVTTTPVYTSTPHTVPVGLVMTVQPAIDAEHGRVTMTLRPTISRVVSEVNDRSIGLNASQAGVANPVQSQIPVLAVREMDSVIRLHSGEVAVMGGLMQDSSINQDQGVPVLDSLPVVGILGKARDNQGSTTELVILLRATIADAPTADDADSDVYERYGRDPRPVPTRSHSAPPLPKVPVPKTSPDVGHVEPDTDDKADDGPADEAAPREVQPDHAPSSNDPT